MNLPSKLCLNFIFKNMRWKKLYKITIRVRLASSSSGFPRNIVFFGTDHFAVTSLKSLICKKQEGYIDKLHIVTTLKKPYSEVASFCLSSHTPFSSWPLETSLEGYDLGIVVSFGHLIPQDIINLFPLGIWNVHGSLLPRWRGPAPIIHAVLNGDRVTGITIMKIHPYEFDTGKIIYQENIQIQENVKSGALAQQMATLGAKCLISSLNNTQNLLDESKLQPETGVSKAPKIKKRDSEIIWNRMTPPIIKSMFLAFDDHIPLWSHWHETEVNLRKLTSWHWDDEDCSFNNTQIDDAYQCIKKLKQNFQRHSSEDIQKGIENNCRFFSVPGQVCYIKDKKVIKVKCLHGSVEFGQMKVKGKKTMNASDFNNGFISKLNKSKHFFH